MTFASFLTQEMIFYLSKKFVYSSLQILIYVCGMGIFHCRHSLLHISFQFPIPSLPTTIVISALYDDRDDLWERTETKNVNKLSLGVQFISSRFEIWSRESAHVQLPGHLGKFAQVLYLVASVLNTTITTWLKELFDFFSSIGDNDN